MKKYLLILLLLAGCKTDTVTPTGDGHVSTPLGTAASDARTQLNAKVAGDAVAAQKAIEPLPSSRNKDVANMFLDDIVHVTGGVTLDQKTSFEKLADQLVSPDAKLQAAGEAQWAKVAADNDVLKAKVATLETQYKNALEKERNDGAQALKDAVNKAKADADAKQRTLITWIFFGGGGILLAAAALVLFLASSNPVFGPKVALGLGAAGAVSILTGIGVIQLLDHPAVVWWGLGTVCVLLAGAAGLMFSNHFHAKETPNA